jgi:hypothetical protein
MDRFQILKNPGLRPCHAPAGYFGGTESQIPVPPIQTGPFSPGLQSLFTHTELPPVNIRPENPRDQGLNGLLATALGRSQLEAAILGAAMIAPITQRIQISSLARRIFLAPEPELSTGPLVMCDRIDNNPAYYINNLGDPQLSALGNFFVMPAFEISSQPEISLASLRRNRRGIELFEQVQNLAAVNIRQVEDDHALRLLQAMSTHQRTITATVFNSEESIGSVLRRAFASIEGNDFRVANIFFNAVDYVNFRYHFRNLIDPQRQRDLLTSNPGNLWGANIICSQMIPVGNIYLTAEPHCGILRSQPITVISSDDPSNMALRFFISERISMACYNPLAMARVTLPPSEVIEARPPLRTVSPIRRIGFEDILEDFTAQEPKDGDLGDWNMGDGP